MTRSIKSQFFLITVNQEIVPSPTEQIKIFEGGTFSCFEVNIFNSYSNKLTYI